MAFGEVSSGEGSIKEAVFPGLARWRKRRTPAPFEFTIADRIAAINPVWWDAVSDAHSVFFSRDYLSMLEHNAPRQLSPRYALLSRRGQPMAALVMQRLELQTERLLSVIEPEADWKKRLSHSAKALVSRPLDARRVLVLGNLLTYGQHAIAADPALAPSELWHGATETLYRLRRAEKLEGSADFQLIKDLDGGDIERANSLTDFGYRLAETEPNMMLTLNPAWKTHTDYLNDLSSKYRKNALSRVLTPFEDPSFRIGVIANPAVIAARIHALYLQVHEAADLRPFTLPESYWAALPETFGKRLRIVGLWHHEQLIGFVAMLLDRDRTVYAYHIGFDREAAKIAPVYLRLLHAAIAEGIAMGGERISLGRTALEPKATLGAKPERTVVYARHRQPLLNKLLRGVLTHIDHDEAPERNPFKQSLGK